MLHLLREFSRDDRGQDLVEYSLLIVFMSLFVVWLGTSGSPIWVNIWSNANSLLTTARNAINY